MFTKACSQYWDLQCYVGVGSLSSQGSVDGIGCLLAPDIIITARHIFNNTRQLNKWPVVAKFDGAFKCSIIYESKAHDIALLKTVEKVDNLEHRKPSKYPVVSTKRPSLGNTAGYLSRLYTYKQTGGTDSYSYFSQGCISFMHPGDADNISFYGLTGGIIQRGFSGSPVITADGKLIGIIVQSLRLVTDSKDIHGSVTYVPVMSPLDLISKEIEEAIKKN
jgi:hypothetical protein